MCTEIIHEQANIGVFQGKTSVIEKGFDDPIEFSASPPCLFVVEIFDSKMTHRINIFKCSWTLTCANNLYETL